MASSERDSVLALVEIPKGSRNKYELNQETGQIELDRRLFAAVSYPTEYGFVQGTRTAEGDELDALVAVSEATFAGCAIRMKPVAMLRMYDGDEPDHKILGVPEADPAWSDLEEVDELPGDLAQEIEHFFSVYTDLEGKEWRIEGWGSREEAWEVIREAEERYRAQQDE
jgi:inorganic pyrophosphatase